MNCVNEVAVELRLDPDDLGKLMGPDMRDGITYAK